MSLYIQIITNSKQIHIEQTSDFSLRISIGTPHASDIPTQAFPSTQELLRFHAIFLLLLRLSFLPFSNIEHIVAPDQNLPQVPRTLAL